MRGDLAIVGEKIPYKVKIEMVENLESRIDSYIEAPPLERFILPGGSESAAAIHIARTVGRAERCIVSLQKKEK